LPAPPEADQIARTMTSKAPGLIIDERAGKRTSLAARERLERAPLIVFGPAAVPCGRERPRAARFPGHREGAVATRRRWT